MMLRSHIPVEIITKILSCLPVKPLVRFLCVSKQWYAVITSSHFIKMHLNRSIETNRERTLILKEDNLPPPTHYFSVDFLKDKQFGKAVEIYQPLHDPLHNWDILDHCHGLVCLEKDDEAQDAEEVLTWNPLIRKYRKLPIEPIEEPSGFSGETYSVLAFGHDPYNNDYKVLRLIHFDTGDKVEFVVKVYGLRSQSWKKIEEQWPNNKQIYTRKSTSLNGAIHWLVADQDQRVLNATEELLLAFDLATEKFQLYSMPFIRNIYMDRHLEEEFGSVGRIYLCYCER
ncbi:hypothetical protein SO802_006440 [Lithocarpus litseifolius]|uniref:F-box domain-containing protein n=1 Tax=Lithocarpus litseifolius TaxID=425828 RepID=A0AAW2DKV5_9ROSI